MGEESLVMFSLFGEFLLRWVQGQDGVPMPKVFRVTHGSGMSLGRFDLVALVDCES